jgi:PIN domain nuclease of toxin-antitoxin system
MRPLVDTHVLLWWFEKERHLFRAERRVLGKASAANPVLVSEISLWEIATLLDLGRIRLSLPLRQWLDQATAPPLVERVPISPAIAAETANLPASFHRDPADRIIVASARIVGATLLTHDERIVKSGVVPILTG